MHTKSRSQTYEDDPDDEIMNDKSVCEALQKTHSYVAFETSCTTREAQRNNDETVGVPMGGDLSPWTSQSETPLVFTSKNCTDMMTSSLERLP